MKKFKLFVSVALFSVMAFILLPTVNASEFSIVKVDPEYSYSNTDFNFTMRVVGTGFVEGTEVEVYYPTSGFIEPVVKSVDIVSSTELKAEIEINFNTYAGFYNVKLTSPSKEVCFIENGLELKKKTDAYHFYPVITSVDPASVVENNEQQIIIMGEQFAGDNPLVRLIRIDGPEYFDLEAVRLNHTEISAVITVSMPVGTYDVLVRGTGGFGDNQFIKTQAFVVESYISDPVPDPSPELDLDPVVPPLSDEETKDSIDVPLPPTSAPDNIPLSNLFDYQASFVDQNGVVKAGNDGVITHVVQGAGGSDIDMWIRLKNTSLMQWWFAAPVNANHIHEIRLGLTKDISSLFTHNSWISTNRLTKITDNVLPGETSTLNFKLSIPEDTVPGAYKLSVGLVAEWIAWMYDDVHWEIQVI